ncbi:transcriptional regulator [Nocardia panacis]|uniref:Transcriptional regulator n=1 Tax=Nocardia panacis TaxID=2340916 RepID=A0A3A4KIX1_9NOCA|nr:helix-turn-helix domain-containing protein [Nocardia panacis]RJO74822.1 transcriptional regulator [Nocardia panacis]
MRSASRPARRDPALDTLELLGQRWMLRILWELRPGPLGFLELRRRMDNCSSSMLSARLQQLQANDIVAKRPDKAWELTTAGKDLGRVLDHLTQWSTKWPDSSTR